MNHWSDLVWHICSYVRRWNHCILVIPLYIRLLPIYYTFHWWSSSALQSTQLLSPHFCRWGTEAQRRKSDLPRWPNRSVAEVEMEIKAFESQSIVLINLMRNCDKVHSCFECRVLLFSKEQRKLLYVWCVSRLQCEQSHKLMCLITTCVQTLYS